MGGTFGWLTLVTCASMCIVLVIQQLGGEAVKIVQVSPHYRPDIDGLRAFAVLVVLVYHLDKHWIPNGYLGVDILFVISGFVVTQSLFHDAEGGLLTYYRFYARRAKRLMPGCLLMICLAALFSATIVPIWSMPRLGFYTTGRYALIGMTNNLFAFHRMSYFDMQGMDPFLHTWSLGVEEQFYFVFPLILVMAHGASLPSENERSGLQLRPLVVLGLLTACSMLAASCMSAELGFYLLPARFWQLAFGVILCEVSSSNFTSIHIGDFGICGMSTALQGMALLLMGYPVFTSTHGGLLQSQHFLKAFLTSCGAVCFIGAGCFQHNSHLNICFGNRLLVYLGRISYPLYLFHWPVIALCGHAFSMESTNMKIGCGMVSIALAMFTYHAMELPIQRKCTSSTWVVLALAGGGVLFGQSLLMAMKGPLGSSLWMTPEFSPQPHPAPFRRA